MTNGRLLYGLIKNELLDGLEKAKRAGASILEMYIKAVKQASPK